MFDAQALFSDEQAITDTAVSTNFLNLGEAATPPQSPAALRRDIGAGNNMPLAILVTETFATLTSLNVSVEVDDNSSFSSAKTVGATGVIPAAALVQGAYLPLTNVPIGTNERYMRLRYTVAGTTATAGKITAGIATGIPAHG